ncbi:MAG: penicillin-binding protein 1C [Elusimicrobia bacterium]|nr:penicillin-binding protein 1C [Elusimicrobiota bacterium]
MRPRFSARARVWLLCALAAAGLPLLAALYAGAVLRPVKSRVSLSREVYDRNGRLLRLTLSPDQKYRRWTPLSGISPLLVEATLLQEDRWFRFHPGVNPVALARAVRRTYLGHGPRVGGSTISMQLARIIYRIDSSSVSGKVKQIAAALWLELTRSKNDILESYLNLVSYGGNIEGAGAASLLYLGKEPSALTVTEALTLGVIPKSPLRRTPLAASGGGAAPRPIELARAELFRKWIARHRDDSVLAPLLTLPSLGEPGENLPFHAPHFVDSVLADYPQNRLNTTLDLRMQSAVERQVRAYVRSKRDLGIHNAAVLLVDVSDMGVRASVGSADFFNGKIAGQVDVTRAPRSPGSALKPFIYALAMDQGFVHPLTLLKDAPLSYGGFNPENFDGDFRGPIYAKDALTKSRNVPAVRLALQLKSPTFYSFLKNAGVPLREESHYGLTLALGGEEITMCNAAELYAMLLNNGEFRPVRRLLDQPLATGRSLLSPEASYITLSMLRETARQEENFRRQWLKSSIPVAWKTGTSSGFRDAWSAGVFGHYAVITWVGNADGRPNPVFVGVSAAAPLMFRVIDALRVLEPGMPQIKPRYMKDLRTVKVCPVSGRLPGRFCKKTVETLFIAGQSPIQSCDIHRQVEVDADTGLSVCPEFIGRRKSVIYEFWPSDLSAIFAVAGMPRRSPPELHPDCVPTAASRGSAPSITSPRAGVDYLVRLAGEARDTIPFTAVTDADVRELFWFVDGKFTGSAQAGKALLWKALPGPHVLRVVDDHGRASTADLNVALEQ